MFGVNFGFKIDVFNEISWQKFKILPRIKSLPLNEQVKKYNLYINELTYQRNVYLHWLEGHKKGESGNFLLQEDLFFLLQEDGSKIIIT